MFIDKVKIYVKSGNGGNGSVSFRREKYVSHGGPDGGDGGHGGNIIFVIDEGINTLLNFKYRRKFVAENGSDGSGAKFHGKNGADLEIMVPPGTVLKDPETEKIIKDMSDEDVVESGRFVFLKGGKGGFGNTHFATPTRQTPNFAKAGIKGKEQEVVLELKMLADAGLVGMPSAGKSTILSVVSAAKPKIADYHFTTLAPMLGVVNAKAGQFVLADLPGLIEGAHNGDGLGHQFLRHIDRCRLIINVVDASGFEGRDPVEDIEKINEELRLYSPELASRPRIIAANKIDMMSDETQARLEEFAKKQGCEIVFIAAGIAHGTDELCELIAKKLKDLPPIKVFTPEYIPEEETVDIDADSEITITRENDTFYVECPRIVKVLNSINFNDRESFAYFQKILRSTGIIDALEEKGIVDGQTVNLYDVEFDYYK
ncbi:MAG: GTPase ObgE [Clostridia bacterium]|nr:GTPase ObgE [Clostridia bacterium]